MQITETAKNSPHTNVLRPRPFVVSFVIRSQQVSVLLVVLLRPKVGAVKPKPGEDYLWLGVDCCYRFSPNRCVALRVRRVLLHGEIAVINSTPIAVCARDVALVVVL